MTRALIVCSLLGFLTAGCGSSGDPAKVTYAPSLGVNLRAMQKSSSGLYTQDLVEGTGADARAGSTATVNYTGWLPDGTKFDSSYDHGQAFQFVLGAGQVIKGWDEGVVGMKVAGKRRLVLPSSLGYGADGVPGAIPPDSVLIFDVDLLSVSP